MAEWRSTVDSGDSKSDDIPIVAVIDADASTRSALESLILSTGFSARVFTSAAEFLACPRMRAPSCLILEVELPDLCGLELQQRIADRFEMPVLFLTRHSDVLATVRAMKAGALEYMTKPFHEETLLSAIGTAIELSRLVLNRTADLEALRERYTYLSGRERQVMALVVRGLLNKLIAAELGISEITVKAHRGKMMRKMRARSLPELVTIAAKLSVATGPKSDIPIRRPEIRYWARIGALEQVASPMIHA